MPKSDTWLGDVAVEKPGGITVETLGGMDSAGSCDSVVSIHSGFSDGSLEELSAEERECILFLEETLESLEAEEESDLPSDEPDLHLAPSSLAEKIAHLSASLSGSISKHLHDGPKGEVGREHKSVPGLLVPTPLVMANSSQPITEPGLGPAPTASPCHRSSTGQDATAPNRKEGREDRPKTGPSRGPLSYEGLIELRSKPPLKKHAQSFSSGDRERAKLSPNNPSEGSQSHRPSGSPSQHPLLPQTPKPKATPPMVAPKPRKLPPSIDVSTQKAAVPTTDPRTHCLGTSPRERGMMDPQQVRREALAKLGLLQDGGAVPPPVARSQHPATTRPRSRSDLPPITASSRPPLPTGGKSVTLDRSGVGVDSSGLKPRTRIRATSLRDKKELAASQPDTPATEPTAQKPLLPNNISVAMTPWNQPGQVRQEALRKLGLLRE
ncbi:specifically androgen-regulated gene protein-like [Conger conger]|uniref:specifically androgen-regulated gene protein-like n=1 Tax=Conger conger TaxID=82655 RepID=UPI002A5A5467|nr:specifically androgen-regulated gene protein-like [Conger conger]